MSLLDWFKKILGLGPRTRDISRLDPRNEESVDHLFETIHEGGPLKEGHRRLALRDRRLLPKSRRRSVLDKKRKRLYTASDAVRLFSATIRTRDRNIRDLLPDQAQLERHGLPTWRTEQDLADALGLRIGQLRAYSIHRERDAISHYVMFRRPKRNGGYRVIMAPKRRLRAIHRTLLSLLVARLPVSDHAHGFRKGRSVVSGAAPHVGKAILLHMDLQDFFPTVHVGRVRGLLIALGYGYVVATTLAVLMTEAERQPVDIDGCIYHVPVSSRYCVQGAPTSPGLCNAIALRMDRRLAGLARRFGFAYTRYADDLTFSGDDPKGIRGLQRRAGEIIANEGFTVNEAKTRIMRRGGRQVVTGVTVNQVLGLSRRERRSMRAEAHQISRSMAEGTLDPERLARFRGRLAWLSMLNREQAEAIERVLAGNPRE